MTLNETLQTVLNDAKPIGGFATEVKADTLFSPKVLSALLSYIEREETNYTPKITQQIQAAKSDLSNVNPDLLHQSQPGKNLQEQIASITGQEYFSLIEQAAKPLPGYRIQKGLIKSTMLFLNSLVKRDNIKNNTNNTYPLLSKEGIRFVETFFGSELPNKLDLYDILGEQYPSFHARSVQQVPEEVAEQLLSGNMKFAKKNELKGIR